MRRMSKDEIGLISQLVSQSLSSYGGVNVVDVDVVNDLKSRLENAEEENARLRSEIENLKTKIARLNLTTLRQKSEIIQLKKERAEQNKEMELVRDHLEKVIKVMEKKDKE